MSWIDDLRRLLRRAKQEDDGAAPPGEVSCQEAAERLFEWLDGELDPQLEPLVGAHLQTCAKCIPRLEFERSFRDALIRASRDREAPEALRRKIVEALEAEGLEPEGPPP